MAMEDSKDGSENDESKESTMDNGRLVNALASRIDAHLAVKENASRENIERLDRWGDELTDAIRELVRKEIADVARLDDDRTDA